MKTIKSKIIEILERKPLIDDQNLSIEANCAIGYAYRIRREFEEQKEDERRRLEGGEYANALWQGKSFTAAIIADVHVPYHHQKSMDVAINWIVKKGPDMVIILGDFADFYKISFWRTDPNRMEFNEELDMCVDQLKYITRPFRESRKIYIEGNHEERLRMYLNSNAKHLRNLKVLKFENLLQLDQLGWEFVSSKTKMMHDEPPYSIGKLYLIHGHEKKITAGAVNHSKLFYDYCRVNLIAAHHHRTTSDTFPKINGKLDGAWTIGCLCQLHPEFCVVNKWCHGIALVHVDSDGDFAVENKKIINGKVL